MHGGRQTAIVCPTSERQLAAGGVYLNRLAVEDFAGDQ
jgi:hypothetical protein